MFYRQLPVVEFFLRWTTAWRPVYRHKLQIEALDLESSSEESDGDNDNDISTDWGSDEASTLQETVGEVGEVGDGEKSSDSPELRAGGKEGGSCSGCLPEGDT